MEHDVVLGYLIWLKQITIDGLTQNLRFSVSLHLHTHYQHWKQAVATLICVANMHILQIMANWYIWYSQTFLQLIWISTCGLT